MAWGHLRRSLQTIANVDIFEDLEPNYYHFMDADGTPRTSFGGGRLGTT